jgi:hypothetical protein
MISLEASENEETIQMTELENTIYPMPVPRLPATQHKTIAGLNRCPLNLKGTGSL